MMPPRPLDIAVFSLGTFQTNCYVLSRPGTPGNACWLIDVGENPGEMFDHVEESRLRVEKIILTHAHADHIAGLGEAARRYPGVPILIHEAEKDFIGDASLNLSLYIATPIVGPDPTGTLAHGQSLDLDGLAFHILHTPGHSPGGITLHQPQQRVAIVGDTLFAGSIGRFDFPTSDGVTLLNSIHEQLLTLPDDTQVFPGHGPATTIARERADNPYLRETTMRFDR